MYKQIQNPLYSKQYFQKYLGKQSIQARYCQTQFRPNKEYKQIQNAKSNKLCKQYKLSSTNGLSNGNNNIIQNQEQQQLLKIEDQNSYLSTFQDNQRLINALLSQVESQQHTIQKLTKSVEQQQAQLFEVNLRFRKLTNRISDIENNLSQDNSYQEYKQNSTQSEPEVNIADRRGLGLFDARYCRWGATPKDQRILPERIILVRHAQSVGNIDNKHYENVPDPQIPLSEIGVEQAKEAGRKVKDYVERKSKGKPYKLFFYTSPYKRSIQTHEQMMECFTDDQIYGASESVQLREQDFGNFQDLEGKKKEKEDRIRFGRFWYRFPNGESGADVYDRITMFEDFLIRNINAGRFQNNTTLVLVTHGLALRVFLMRWFHWTVEQFHQVWNPDNAEPVYLDRITSEQEGRPGGPVSWIHTKALYQLAPESARKLEGIDDDMRCTQYYNTTLLKNYLNRKPKPAEECHIPDDEQSNIQFQEQQISDQFQGGH